MSLLSNIFKPRAKDTSANTDASDLADCPCDCSSIKTTGYKSGPNKVHPYSHLAKATQRLWLNYRNIGNRTVLKGNAEARNTLKYIQRDAQDGPENKSSWARACENWKDGEFTSFRAPDIHHISEETIACLESETLIVLAKKFSYGDDLEVAIFVKHPSGEVLDVTSDPGPWQTEAVKILEAIASEYEIIRQKLIAELQEDKELKLMLARDVFEGE